MITGAHERIDGQDHLVLTRTFRAPIEDVWAAMTESSRLARWFASWSGDPSSGRVAVTWVFEGDAPTEDYVIEVCEPPRRLRVHNDVPDPADVWTIDVGLDQAGGVTTLRFSQVLTDTSIVTDVGPGWEYYLDRLEESMRTGETATTEWEGYLAKGAEYAAAFGLRDPDTVLLLAAVTQLEALVAAADQTPEAETPCTEWNAHRLAEHVVSTTSDFARSMRGEDADRTSPAAEIDGPVGPAFANAAADLLSCRSRAEAPGDVGGQLAELAVHTWDLATAVGHPTRDLDQGVAERGLAFMEGALTEDRRGELFKPATSAPDGADAYQRIAAFAGRPVA